jgi:uncharacterized RDD family membrane protein YckC
MLVYYMAIWYSMYMAIWYSMYMAIWYSMYMAIWYILVIRYILSRFGKLYNKNLATLIVCRRQGDQISF